MIIDYKRDLNNNYMILQSEEVDTKCFQFRMLQANRISGLLSFSVREMNNRAMFYYDITSRQSVSSLLEHHMVSCKMVRDLFCSLFQVLDRLETFLLSPDGLMLKPELIYADASLDHYSFVFLPVKGECRKSLQQALTELMEMLLPRLDHSNQEGVVLGYGIYRELTGEDFSLDALKGLVFQKGKNELEELYEERDRQNRAGKTADHAYRSEEEWKQEEDELHKMVQQFFESEDEEEEEDKIRTMPLILGLILGIVFLAAGACVLLYSEKPAVAGGLGIAGIVFIAAAILFWFLKEYRESDEEEDEEDEAEEEDEDTEKIGIDEESRDRDEFLNGKKELAKKDAGKRTAGKRTAGKKEDGKKKTEKKVAGDKDRIKKNGINKEAVNREAVNKGAVNKEIFNKEISNKEISNKEAINKDVMHRDVIKEEPIDREMTKRKPAHKAMPEKMMYELTEVLYVPSGKKQVLSLLPEKEDFPIISFQDKKLILIGKLASAVDVVLPSGTVSRIHAKLEQTENGVFLSDLNSRNGTLVNDELLQNGEARKLIPGDEVSFADIRYTYSQNEV